MSCSLHQVNPIGMMSHEPTYVSIGMGQPDSTWIAIVAWMQTLRRWDRNSHKTVRVASNCLILSDQMLLSPIAAWYEIGAAELLRLY